MPNEPIKKPLFRTKTPTSTKPTHRLKAKVRTDDNSGAYGDVGAAWLNENGSLSVRLNIGIVLDWRDNCLLTLFPSEASASTETKEEAPY